jgi:oligopeptidase B
MRPVLAAALILMSTPVVAQLPSPPVAKKIPVVTTLHGERRVDDYAYFKDRTHPETIPYLEAENRYTDAMMAQTAELQRQLYDEMLGRIKEDDSQVPVERDGWFYYSRTERGKAYPIFARKRGSLDAAEEVYFDQNAEAAGHEFYSLGGMEVSPDHRRLAVLVDTTGYEDFHLRVKDLTTGRWIDEQLEKLSWGLAWASDNRTLFYMTPDSAKRGDRVWRHVVGEPRATDVSVYQDTDVLFNVNLSRSRNGEWILISSGSFTQSEWHAIPADRPTEAPRVIAPRRPGVEYEVEPGERVFYILTNQDARDFKVMTAPLDAPAAWTDWLPHRTDVFVEGVMAFRRHVVVIERRDGLRQLRITALDGGATHDVSFPRRRTASSLAAIRSTTRRRCASRTAPSSRRQRCSTTT